MWHRWQSIGTFATSIRSLLDPCGSWQVTQFSRPTACSNRNGPRFSAWQLAQLSATELPSLSIFTFCEPWGLWQEEHASLPSRTGMCCERCTLFTTFWWHWAHVSIWVSVFSCAFSDFGACTLWQVRHDRLRASCLPPDHSLCSERLWQVMQVSLTSRAEIFVSCLIFVLSPPPSTCAW